MSRAKKAKETAVTNMLMVMYADGKVTEEEKIAFMVSCAHVGITPEEANAHMENIVSNPESIKLTRPKGAKECLDHLFASVTVMMSDGDMHAKELELCRKYAGALGIPNEIMSDMIEICRKVNTQL